MNPMRLIEGWAVEFETLLPKSKIFSRANFQGDFFVIKALISRSNCVCDIIHARIDMQNEFRVRIVIIVKAGVIHVGYERKLGVIPLLQEGSWLWFVKSKEL